MQNGYQKDQIFVSFFQKFCTFMKIFVPITKNGYYFGGNRYGLVRLLKWPYPYYCAVPVPVPVPKKSCRTCRTRTKVRSDL